MRLLDFICTDAILLDLENNTARGAVDEMVQALVDHKALPAEHHRKVVDAILRREKKGTTGFGNGVAIPHAKHEGIPRVIGTVARSTAGVDFAALDGEPVRLFFLLISSPDQPEEHLKAMEHVFRSIKKDNFRRFMSQATTREEIIDLLQEADEDVR